MSRAILIILAAAATSASLGQSNRDRTGLTVAVAIRYLQITGVSHAHIYLYRADGKLIRRLTDDNSGQDIEPVFAPSGREIVFKRRRDSAEEFWSVQVDGRALHRLDVGPEWYVNALAEPVQRFDYPPDAPLPHDPKQSRLADYVRPGEVRYASPDQSVEIVLKDDPAGAEPADDWYPKTPYLHDVQRGSEIAVTSLPITNFVATGSREEQRMRNKPSGEPPFCSRDPNEPYKLDSVVIRGGSPFYFQDSARLAFLREHHDSTCGESWFAVDLNQGRLVELFPNGGDIIVLPGAPALFCVCQEWYLPLGDDKRTVNCSYVDLWNSQLKRTRFSQAKPARCYGASVYNSATKQRVLVIRPWGLTE